MCRVVCLGDNCADYYDATGEVHFGGNPLNVAVYLRRIGCGSSYLGAVGTDELGRQMQESVKARGVDLSHLQILEGKTALTHVDVTDGERILGDYEEGVMADFALREEDYAFIREHDMAVTGLWGHCEGALARIRREGTRTVFDCADRPDDPAAAAAAPYTDILFFSDDLSDTGTLCEKLKMLYERMTSGAGEGDKSGRLVIATRGEKGSLAYDGAAFTAGGIVSCRVIDTMGAGDSYIAGFIAALLDGSELAVCMRRGAKNSAVTLGYAGAW